MGTGGGIRRGMWFSLGVGVVMLVDGLSVYIGYGDGCENKRMEKEQQQQQLGIGKATVEK